jgi:hypothetical protein
VQFSYDLTHYDGGDQYNYLHLVYLGQYDNNAFGVGIPRDLNNGRPFRRLMPTQYGLKVVRQPLGRNAGRQRHHGHAVRWFVPDGVDCDRRRPAESDDQLSVLQQRRRVRAIGDTTGIYCRIR